MPNTAVVVPGTYSTGVPSAATCGISSSRSSARAARVDLRVAPRAAAARARSGNGPPPDARRGAGQQVAREVAEDGDHGRPSLPRPSRAVGEYDRAVINADDGDQQGHARARALRRRRAEDGGELRQARARRLLRRRHLPPRDPGLHDPGRRPDRHRHGRARLPVRGRDQLEPDRPRRARDGERGPEHERLAVLHRHRRRVPVARRRAHGLRPRHLRAWTSSTRSSSSRRTARTARSTRSASSRSRSPE